MTVRPSRREELSPDPKGWIAHRFQIRRHLWIVLELPSDFDTTDAERMARWLEALAVRS